MVLLIQGCLVGRIRGATTLNYASALNLAKENIALFPSFTVVKLEIPRLSDTMASFWQARMWENLSNLCTSTSSYPFILQYLL